MHWLVSTSKICSIFNFTTLTTVSKYLHSSLKFPISFKLSSPHFFFFFWLSFCCCIIKTNSKQVEHTKQVSGLNNGGRGEEYVHSNSPLSFPGQGSSSLTYRSKPERLNVNILYFLKMFLLWGFFGQLVIY